jgi:hypothetical protein
MLYRILLASTLLLMFSAGSSFATSREEATAAVTTQYRITTPGFLGGFNEIGTILTPRREGLRANRPSKSFTPNLIKGGQLVAAGGGTQSLGSTHNGALKPGERLHLYDVRTGNDYVQLDLFTVATFVVTGSGKQGPTPLQASVRFQYDGGLAGVTTQQLMSDIGEWLTAEGEPRPVAVAPVAVTPTVVPPPTPVTESRAPVRATGTVKLGQTREEVTAILGAPEKQFLLGAKTIFVYRDVKVVFVDGKVTDAE